MEELLLLIERQARLLKEREWSLDHLTETLSCPSCGDPQVTLGINQRTTDQTEHTLDCEYAQVQLLAEAYIKGEL